MQNIISVFEKKDIDNFYSGFLERQKVIIKKIFVFS